MTDEPLMIPDAPPADAPKAPDASLLTPQPALDFSAGKPEGFPDNFWDAEKNAPNVETMYKEFQNRDKIAKDLRVKLGKGEFEGKAPADIKEYTLELTDDLKALVPDDDKMLMAARQSAKDAGMPAAQFAKFITPVLAELARVQAEHTLTPEQIEAIKTEEFGKLGASGAKIAGAVGSFVDKMESGGTFSKEEADALRSRTDSAVMVRALNKLRMMAGDSDQVPVDVPVDTTSSISDIESKMAKAMFSNNEADYTKYSTMLAKMKNG